MHFLDKEENNVKHSNYIKKNKRLWIARISILAFCLSMLLSLFSELILNKSNILVAILVLCIFLILNVISDMYGLAITSCQIEELKKEITDKNLYNKCLNLIKNSDKVSSILCDVVGDISGILCGVSGTIITIICASQIGFLKVNIILGAIISALIAGITVLLKAIAKNYALKNSLKLVKKSAKIISFIKYFFKLNFKSKRVKNK